MLAIIEYALMGTGIPLDSVLGVAKTVLFMCETNGMLPPITEKQYDNSQLEWEPEDTKETT